MWITIALWAIIVGAFALTTIAVYFRWRRWYDYRNTIVQNTAPTQVGTPWPPHPLPVHPAGTAEYHPSHANGSALNRVAAGTPRTANADCICNVRWNLYREGDKP